MRTVWGYSEDDIGGAGGGAPDVSGFFFEDVDVYVETELDGFEVRMNVDFDSGGSALEDAFIRVPLPDDASLTVGSFKPRVTRSALTDPEDLVFRERTLLGSLFDVWDLGVEYSTGEEPARTTFSVVNGSNGSDSNHAWTLRYDFSAYEERLTDAEGARDAPNYLRMVIGGFYRMDDTVRGKADIWGADLALTMGSWSLHGEFASLDDELAGTALIFDGQALTLGPDAQIWSVTATQRIAPNVHVAGRYQEPDDALDTTTYGFALNWFPTTGPVGFVADATYFDSDGPEGWIFSVGANFGRTRSRPVEWAGR